MAVYTIKLEKILTLPIYLYDDNILALTLYTCNIIVNEFVASILVNNVFHINLIEMKHE